MTLERFKSIKVGRRTYHVHTFLLQGHDCWKACVSDAKGKQVGSTDPTIGHDKAMAAGIALARML